ncbi:MAG: bifunctional glycosyltransferase family 2/GtrA family protein [Clostridia bacterium]|nr:bifunctional glycosyltransferase family 2/GtrA family protein [Clostridia bacterium]
MAEMQSMIQNTVVLIPSLEPDHRFSAYLQELSSVGFGQIVVVDDGSGDGYRHIFSEAEEIDRVTVIHHEVNRGKGAALKTGYRYILDHLPEITGIITADSDGQHTVDDCVLMAEKLAEGKKALYLGSRDFSLPDIPPKSRTGNRITSIVFMLLYGVWLQDTQTGLRAFRREDLDFMIRVGGERFEYEMKVLIACAVQRIPMIAIPIKTVYENGNDGTHFHPIRDSYRIYKVILGGFFKFMFSSLICFAADQILFNVLRSWLFPMLGLKVNNTISLGFMADNTSLANYTARLFSAILNFRLNKDLVFKVKAKKGTAWRYAVTAAAILLMSTLCIKFAGLIGISPWIAKILADTLLYFASYRIQQNWVFKEEI